MPCYDVDIAPIEQLYATLKDIPPELADPAPEMLDLYSREYGKMLDRLVMLYLDAAACFFTIMRAVADRRLALERDSPSPFPVDRGFLLPFLEIYNDAQTRALGNLRRLLTKAFVQNPQLRAEFVSQMVASATVQEQMAYVSAVNTAKTPDEAQAHGETGHQIVDSVKDFLKDFIEDRRFVRMTIGKKNVKRAFHVLNEVLHMVF